MAAKSQESARKSDELCRLRRLDHWIKLLPLALRTEWPNLFCFRYFHMQTAQRLLIVALDFFIQRCAGEVAEWSKALPC